MPIDLSAVLPDGRPFAFWEKECVYNRVLYVDGGSAAASDENARAAMEAIPLLRGCEAHSTVILSEVDAGTFRKLGVNLTCDPEYQTKKLFHN